jgi:hypothetical protein
LRWLTGVTGLLLTTLLLGCNGGDDSENGDTPPPSASPPIITEARVAFVDDTGNVSVMKSNGSELARITDGAGILGLKASPSGSLVALDLGSGVRVIRTDGSTAFELPGATAPTWGTNDRLAVIAEGSVRVTDSAGETVREISSATRPAWSFDGNRIAVVRLDGTLGVPIIVDLATGDETPVSSAIAPHTPDYPIAWHPAGQVIGYRDRVYEPSTGTERTLPGVAVNFSPDGRMLHVTLPDDPARGTTIGRLLDVAQDMKPVIGYEVPGTGQTPGWLYVQPITTWTPDGTRFIYMDPTPSTERVRVFNTVEIRQTQYRGIKGVRPVVSPDSALVMFHDSGKLYILAIDGSRYYSPAVGSHGEWIR